MAELVALSQELSASVGLTIDLPSTSELGYPVVVVRPGRVEHSVAFSRLSPREHEVAALMAEGLRNKQIGERLAISVPTVKDHVHHILDKTGMTSRAAVAVAYSLHAR